MIEFHTIHVEIIMRIDQIIMEGNIMTIDQIEIIDREMMMKNQINLIIEI